MLRKTASRADPTTATMQRSLLQVGTLHQIDRCAHPMKLLGLAGEDAGCSHRDKISTMAQGWLSGDRQISPPFTQSRLYVWWQVAAADPSTDNSGAGYS